MKKLLFIFNPRSGTGKIRSALVDVVDVFTKAGYETTIYPTQAPEDGKRRILENGETYDRIVVSGGDGMLHELVNAVVQLPQAVAVGYLPSGTVNDFAATHSLPRDPVKASEVAVSDHILSLDVGRFNDSWFSYVAAFGLFTQVSYQTNQKLKNKLGSLAYFLEALQSIDYRHFEQACRKMEITADGADFSGEFIFGAVTNSTSIGGFRKLICDGVQFDDGRLEGLFVKKPSGVRELEQMQRGLVRSDFSAACLLRFSAREFSVRSEEMAWTLDGENGGRHSDVRISAVQKTLHIALPRKSIKEHI